jgi:hypothetical protein
MHGLPDRDCARWKLTPAEVQKRRSLFWELFITDCWQVYASPARSHSIFDFTDHLLFTAESCHRETGDFLLTICGLRATV